MTYGNCEVNEILIPEKDKALNKLVHVTKIVYTGLVMG